MSFDKAEKAYVLRWQLRSYQGECATGTSTLLAMVLSLLIGWL